MSSNLRTAISEQQKAFRPGIQPPFAALIERKRRRDVRTRAAAGAGALAVTIAGAAVALPLLGDGQDTVREIAAPPVSVPGDELFGSSLVRADAMPRNHVLGTVAYPGYPARPPLGGDHADQPQQCAVYDRPVPPQNAVHSMEHGAVWITYRPGLPQPAVDRLAGLVRGEPFQLLSPLPGQDSPVVLTAWGRQLAVDTAEDPRVSQFLSAYTNSPLSPEPGAACTGNTTTSE